MRLDEVEAELSLLFTRMQNEPEDRHELYLQIRERMNAMKAFGMPIPKDLLDFETALEAEFAEDNAAALAERNSGNPKGQT
jgi:hypothetical protein